MVAGYSDVFAALSAAGVSYVVVGGTAVVLQGHARMTVDLDLVLDLEPAEVRRGLEVLLGLGLQPRRPVDPYDFADPVVRERWRTERNLTVLSLYDPDDPFREVDLFTVSPLPYEDLRLRASLVPLDGVDVPVASLDDLIAMKRAVARPARPAGRRRSGAVAEPAVTDWSAGTWEGLEREQRRRIAAATPAARLAWLEDALRLAHASGALQRARDERQRECDELWGDSEPAVVGR